jgi:hypothetical protein
MRTTSKIALSTSVALCQRGVSGRVPVSDGSPIDFDDLWLASDLCWPVGY